MGGSLASHCLGPCGIVRTANRTPNLTPIVIRRNRHTALKSCPACSFFEKHLVRVRGKRHAHAVSHSVQPHMHATQRLCSIQRDLCKLCLTYNSHHGSSPVLVCECVDCSLSSRSMRRVTNTATLTATLCGSACRLRMLTISLVLLRTSSQRQ